MDSFFAFLGTAGYPTTMVGGLLLLFFYLRKAEYGVRTEINSSLERLQREKAELQVKVKELETELDEQDTSMDTLRKEKWAVEDEAARLRRQVEILEFNLEQLQLGKS